MATYGLKYQSTFDPIGPVSATPVYTLEIHEKDYVGSVTDVICAGVPVVHSWQTDDPKAPIKGSSLSISLINKNNSLPLESFFSTDDDQFKVRFKWLSQLMFEGFLVQDDCTETMVDFTHEINLSANDNLGLLKDVALDKAKIIYTLVTQVNDTWSLTAPHTLTVPAGIGSAAQAGDVINIFSMIFNVTYHVTDASGGVNLLVSETVVTGSPGGSDDIELNRPVLFADKITLATVLNNCLAATGLELATHVFCNYYTAGASTVIVTTFSAIASLNQITVDIKASKFTVGQTIDITGSISNDGTYTIVSITPFSFFFSKLVVVESLVDESATPSVTVSWDQTLYWLDTLIDPQTFLKDDIIYDNCYAILEKLFIRFGCTGFQAKGVWNIVHWDELRYSGYAIPGFIYDTNFNITGETTLDNGFAKFQIGIAEVTKAENGLLHKILSPLQYAKETFNYKQPARLLRNFDLQELGELLNTSTTGSGITLQTTREYAVTWWNLSTRPDSGTGTHFIRVVSDYLDNEISRLLVLTQDVYSYKIEANKNDAFIFSFTFKTEDSQAGPVTVQAFVEITDGITTNYYHNPASATTGWQVGTGFAYTIFTGDNTNEWHTVEINSTQFPVPFDGILTFYLRVADLSGTINETYYRDIRLEYFFYINESTKIIGHTHTTEQLTTSIKQNEEDEIFMDDSPRNSIAGTLYLDTFVGIIQERTSRWFLANSGDTRRLGDLTTFEMEFWRRIVRSILEGTFYGLVSSDSDHASLLTVFNYTFFPGLNFVGGTMEIDYRNNRFSGTLWEIVEDSEVDADLTSNYEFKYLYSTK